MSSPGRLYEIKQRLMTLISESNLSLIPKNSHVIPDWTTSTTVARNLPIVTVKIQQDINAVTYGRKVPKISDAFPWSGTEGAISEVQFTAHVFCSNNRTTGQPKGKYAQDLADEIIDHLVKEAKNQGVHAIFDIFNLRSNEAEPLKYGPESVSRVIIEGRMAVIYSDKEE